MYLSVRGFSRVMYLNESESGFDLGEKWRDELILRDSNSGGGVSACELTRRERRVLDGLKLITVPFYVRLILSLSQT